MSTELATIEDAEIVDAEYSRLVLPVGSPEEMHNAMVRYQKTKEAVLDKTDYQMAGRESFVKKSGWSKLAIAFGVSTEIRLGYPKYERDAEGRLLRAEFIVRATAPNGRYADGWGSCSSSESRFARAGGAQKIEHDLPASAETRARNRACAALFGHGEVSYEEVALLNEDDPEPARPSEPPQTKPAEPARPPTQQPAQSNGLISKGQSETIVKLSRQLGYTDEPPPPDTMTSAEAAARIAELSKEFNRSRGRT